jgi:hypothetical protein
VTLGDFLDKLKIIATELNEREQIEGLGSYDDFEVIITDYKNGWRQIKNIKLSPTRIAIEIDGELKPKNG